MTRYEGVIEAPIAKEKFYGIMTNPEKVIGFLPDVVESKVNDQDHFKVRAKVGAGPVRGTLDFSFEISEKGRDFVKLKGRGQGMQSVVDLTLQITFGDSPGGTKANWVADAQLGGLLASVGGRLIDGIASKYMKQITENIRKEVSKPN